MDYPSWGACEGDGDGVPHVEELKSWQCFGVEVQVGFGIACVLFYRAERVDGGLKMGF